MLNRSERDVKVDFTTQSEFINNFKPEFYGLKALLTPVH